nr:redox-sensing transcriptional repressor Rex [Spirochaeta sp.]
MTSKSEIKLTESDNSVMRLLKYKITLKRLKSLGLARVFSDNLADSISISSSLVRKDFSLYGISGSKRGGYSIDELIENLDSILGKDKILKVVIAGAGKLGTALLHYKGLEEEHIKIYAVFDNNPDKFNKDAPVPVLPIEQLIGYVQKNMI